MIAVMVMAFAISSLRLTAVRAAPRRCTSAGWPPCCARSASWWRRPCCPDAAVRAPAVRRLDSLMVLAPLWPLAVALCRAVRLLTGARRSLAAVA